MSLAVYSVDGSSIPHVHVEPPPPPPPPSPPTATLQGNLNSAKSRLGQDQSQRTQDVQLVQTLQGWLNHTQNPFDTLSDPLIQGPSAQTPDQIRASIRATQAKVAADDKKIATDEQAVSNAQTQLDAVTPPAQRSDPTAALIGTLKGSVSEDQSNIRSDESNVQDLTTKLATDERAKKKNGDDPVVDSAIQQHTKQLDDSQRKLTQDRTKLARDQGSLKAAQAGQKAANEYPSTAKDLPVSVSNKVTQAADAAQSRANAQVTTADQSVQADRTNIARTQSQITVLDDGGMSPSAIRQGKRLDAQLTREQEQLRSDQKKQSQARENAKHVSAQVKVVLYGQQWGADQADLVTQFQQLYAQDVLGFDAQGNVILEIDPTRLSASQGTAYESYLALEDKCSADSLTAQANQQAANGDEAGAAATQRKADQATAEWRVLATKAPYDAQSEQLDQLKKQLQANPGDPKVMQALTAAEIKEASLQGSYYQAVSYAGELHQQQALTADQNAVATDQQAVGMAWGQYLADGSPQTLQHFRDAQQKLSEDQQRQLRDQRQFSVDQAGLQTASEEVALAPQIGSVNADQDRADALGQHYAQLIGSGQGCTVQGVAAKQTQQRAQAGLKQEQSSATGWSVYQTLNSDASTEAEQVAVWEGQQIQVGIPGAAADASAVVSGVLVPGSHSDAWELSVSDSQEPAGSVPELTTAAAATAVQQGQFEQSLATSDYWESIFDLSLPANLQNPQTSQDEQAQNDAWDEFVRAHGLTQLSDRDVAAQLENLGPDGRVDAQAGVQEILSDLNQQHDISASRPWSERVIDAATGTDPGASAYSNLQDKLGQVEQLLAKKRQLTRLQYNQQYENIMGTLGPQFDHMAASERAAIHTWDQAQTAVVDVVASAAAVTFGGWAGVGMFLLYSQGSKALDNIVTLQAGGKVTDDSGISLLTAATDNFGKGGWSGQQLASAAVGFGTDALSGKAAVLGGQFGKWLVGKAGAQWLPATLTKWGVQGLETAPTGASVADTEAVIWSNMDQSMLVRAGTRGASLTGFQAVAGTGQVLGTGVNAFYGVATGEQTAAQAWDEVQQSGEAMAFDTVVAPFVGGLGGMSAGRAWQIGSDVVTNTALTLGYNALTGQITLSDWISLGLNTLQGVGPHVRRSRDSGLADATYDGSTSAKVTEDGTTGRSSLSAAYYPEIELPASGSADTLHETDASTRPRNNRKLIAGGVATAIAAPLLLRFGVHDPSPLQGAMSVGMLPVFGRLRRTRSARPETPRGPIPEVWHALARTSGDPIPADLSSEEHEKFLKLLDVLEKGDDRDFSAALLFVLGTLSSEERERVLDNGQRLLATPSRREAFLQFLTDAPPDIPPQLQARRAVFGLWSDDPRLMSTLIDQENRARNANGPAPDREELITVADNNDVPVQVADFTTEGRPPTISLEALFENQILGDVRRFSARSNFREGVTALVNLINNARSNGKPLNIVIETGARAPWAGRTHASQYGPVGTAQWVRGLRGIAVVLKMDINVTVVADRMSVPVVKAVNESVGVDDVEVQLAPQERARSRRLDELDPHFVISIGKSTKLGAEPSLVEPAKAGGIPTFAITDATDESGLEVALAAEYRLFASNVNLGGGGTIGAVLQALGLGGVLHGPEQEESAYKAADRVGAIRDDERFEAGATPGTLDIEAHVGTWHLMNIALGSKGGMRTESARPLTWGDHFTADYQLKRMKESGVTLDTYAAAYKQALPPTRFKDKVALQRFQLSQAGTGEKVRTAAGAAFGAGSAAFLYAASGTTNHALEFWVAAIAGLGTSARQLQIGKTTFPKRAGDIVLERATAGTGKAPKIRRPDNHIGWFDRWLLRYHGNDAVSTARFNRRAMKSVRTRAFTYTTTVAATVQQLTELHLNGNMHGSAAELSATALWAFIVGLQTVQLRYSRILLSARVMPDGKMYYAEPPKPTGRAAIWVRANDQVSKYATVFFGVGSGESLDALYEYHVANADPTIAVNIALDARSSGNMMQGADTSYEGVKDLYKGAKRLSKWAGGKLHISGKASSSAPVPGSNKPMNRLHAAFDDFATLLSALAIPVGAALGEYSLENPGPTQGATSPPKESNAGPHPAQSNTGPHPTEHNTGHKKGMLN